MPWLFRVLSSDNEAADAVLWSEVDELLLEPFRKGNAPRAPEVRETTSTGTIAEVYLCPIWRHCLKAEWVPSSREHPEPQGFCLVCGLNHQIWVFRSRGPKPNGQKPSLCGRLCNATGGHMLTLGFSCLDGVATSNPSRYRLARKAWPSSHGDSAGLDQLTCLGCDL